MSAQNPWLFVLPNPIPSLHLWILAKEMKKKGSEARRRTDDDKRKQMTNTDENYINWNELCSCTPLFWKLKLTLKPCQCRCLSYCQNVFNSKCSKHYLKLLYYSVRLQTRSLYTLCVRGVNLVWNLGIEDSGLKTNGGSRVLKVQQMEDRSTWLRVSSQEFLFNYTQIIIFMKSNHFGKCFHL